MHRTTVVVLLVSGLLAYGPRITIQPAAPVMAATQRDGTCGEERWHIKTLDDAGGKTAAATVPQAITVQGLRALPAPDGFDKFDDAERYAPVEGTVYKVRAQLVGWKHENDHDYHIVIKDPDDPFAADTMVVEAVDPTCGDAIDSGFAKRYSAVRASFDRCFGPPSARFTHFPPMTVDLTGVGFYDPDHGQTGRATLWQDDADHTGLRAKSKVDIELHPLLSVKTVSGACPISPRRS